MNVEKYWSQDTVYFFATCALFPEKLNGVLLDEKQLNDFITNIEDFQTRTLLQYQEKGMLKLQTLGDSEAGFQFVITDINQLSFKKELIDYLEKYREDELLPGFSSYGDSYEDTKQLLYSYLRKSGRKYPLVSPRNIWGYWSGRPFWEIILATDLLDGDVSIKDIELVHDTSFYSDSLPRAKLEVIKPLDRQPIANTNKQSAWLKMTSLSFSKWRVYIELDDGGIFPLKDNLTEGHAPHSLLDYLIKHPGELVTLQYAKQKIKYCNNVHKLGEKLRQCHFDDPLKALVFDECGNTEVRLKQTIQLSRAQLKELGIMPSE